jgi:hypothetical protein
MTAAWALVRIWHTVLMRGTRCAARRSARNAEAPAVAPSSGNHLDDADEWRSTVNRSWFQPRD